MTHASLTLEVTNRIHALAEKYNAPEEVEHALQRIYLLEKHVESADHARRPEQLFDFDRTAAAHYRAGVDEGHAKRRIEEIFLAHGAKRAEAWNAATALARQAVALAWENPNWL